MERLEIKDNFLYISDEASDFQVQLEAIDIACTDKFVINLKLYDGKQAYLHPDSIEDSAEFDALANLLTRDKKFFQCDGYMVVNLENLQECSVCKEKDDYGYYNLDMRFKRMKGGLASKDIHSLIKVRNAILEAKQKYEEENTDELIKG